MDYKGIDFEGYVDVRSDKHGKIVYGEHMCYASCQSYRIFNKKFNQKLRMEEGDYLDINKIKDKQEIFDFAAKPKQYCRYCGDFIRWFEWQRSKKDISEWV